MKIYVPNAPFEQNMDMIREAHYRQGSVMTIMCVIDNGIAYCLEGSHRIYLQSLQDELTQEYELYLMKVDKNHRFYMGYDNNYLVSEESAPQWVKDDLDLCVAWDVIKSYTNKVSYEISVDKNSILELDRSIYKNDEINN